ncbi:aldo/keto reductase [Streptomyces rimosus]|uniref:aldo/keto reductase n=1 Tax=Streptomyces rimosus TaxID=1927 RepID=UPI001F2B24E2|nr:aldo/keto reductase [Streptomyces rimosus]
MTASSSDAAGTFEVAGKKVARLGFGAMRLTGPGVWGEPDDRRECVRVVRRAVGLGGQLIDTADCYGSYVSEEIIREAIPPYGPLAWPPVGRPEYLLSRP